MRKEKPKVDKNNDNPNMLFAKNNHKHHQHHEVIQEVNITINNTEQNTEDGVVGCFKSLFECMKKK